MPLDDASSHRDGPFDQLVAWLRQLDRRVGHLEHLERRVANLEAGMGSLIADDAALNGRLVADENGIAEVEMQIAALTAAIESLLPGPATQLTVTLTTGGNMPGVAISIDDTAGKASFGWLDDHNEATTTAPLSPDGTPITVTLACDNPAVATLTADPATPQTWDITPVAEGGLDASGTPDGSVNVTVTAVDDAGNPAVFANGTAVTAAPSPFGVAPGPAAGMLVTVAA